MTIRKLLIANRGEIARRIIRTARAQGIQTVAVYSSADRHAPFVSEADEAIAIGPAASRESYLKVEALVTACRQSGADAIHPGYGFLSENGDFARAVIDAGITWVGPEPEAIDAMGSKAEAKALMEQHAVPTVPGYSGDDQSLERLKSEAASVAYPLLLKASAGGGGKGMRIVLAPEGLEDAIHAARREAESSFGDSRLILERYIERPRHIEFQILGAKHGNLVHLFERECSVQRRHQKVLEEAPAPGLSEALRSRMAEAAMAAGRALDYSSAGTVEFILAPDGEFYFLEVNTRLQVEHPVTEMTTGLDLVALQLSVAEGAPLPFSQEDIALRGHAIEARLYAEDADAGFLPCTGHLLDWHFPKREGVRLDSGVECGSEVSVHYDPMLAKVIAYGATRALATRRLRACLEGASVLGVTTNQRFLCRVLDSDAWRDGELHTHFIEDNADELGDTSTDEGGLRAALVATCLHVVDSDEARRILPGVRYAWRNNPAQDEQYSWSCARSGLQHTISIANVGPSRWRLGAAEDSFELEVIARGEGSALIAIDDHARHYRVRSTSEDTWVHDGVRAHGLSPIPVFPIADGDEREGGCKAPMPGKVLSVHVAAGDTVEEGQPLVTLEAMKMEHALCAYQPGIVTEVLVVAGDQVSSGEVLALVEPAGQDG